MRLLDKIPKNVRLIALIGVLVAALISLWLGNSREVDRLLAMANKGDRQMRLNALAELGSMGGSADGAVEDLSLLVRNRDREVRSAAISALIQISKPDAAKALMAALGSRDTGVRLDAREALERIRHPSVQATLQNIDTRSRKRHQRTRLNGWASGIRRKLEKQRERDYKRHRKVYGIERR